MKASRISIGLVAILSLPCDAHAAAAACIGPSLQARKADTARKPATIVSMLVDAKSALERCQMLSEEFLSDDELITSLGAKSIKRMVPGPGFDGAFVDSSYAGNIEIYRFRDRDQPSTEPLRLVLGCVDVRSAQLRIGDVRRIFGSDFEARDYYAQPAIANSHMFHAPPVTDPMGNEILKFRIDTGPDVTSEVDVRFTGDGIVEAIYFRQWRTGTAVFP